MSSDPKEQPENRLDRLFLEAFTTNHPAAHDWAAVKMELKRLRASSPAQAPAAPASKEGNVTQFNAGPTLSSENVEVDKDSPIAQLWKLLDDIDTASDMFKPSLLEGILNLNGYVKFYNYAIKKVGERFKHLTSDGYKLYGPKTTPTSKVRP